MATPATHDIYITKGDECRLWMKMRSSGSPSTINLVQSTIEAQIRLTVDSADPLATFTVESTDLANGIFTLVLQESVTQALNFKRLASAKWDLQVTTAGITKTYVRGDVYLTNEVTR